MAELRRIAGRDPGALADAFADWRANLGPGSGPRGSVLLVNQATAEFLAARRDDGAVHLVEALLSVAIKDFPAQGHPFLYFLTAPLHSIPMNPSERRGLLALGPVLPNSSFTTTWQQELQIGNDDQWEAYVRQLDSLSRADGDPTTALAACVWLHGLYMHDWHRFPLGLPPAAIRLTETFGYPQNWSESILDPWFEAAYTAGDSDAMALQEEIGRARGRSPWLQIQTLGVWSLRTELSRRFPDREDPAEYKRLRDLALRMLDTKGSATPEAGK